MFKDIVLAVTPSEVCECAADKAFAFAQRFEAKLTILHVTGMEQGWGQVRHLEASGETERIKENIRTFYSEKLKGLADYGIHVVPGMPHNEILRVARKVNADLIIMGPHTKEYAEKRSKMWGMAGSTLERVSRKARCPVMIVTRDAPYGEQKFDTILCATDFSEQAECAVQYGAQLARQYKARMILFHALDASDLGQEEITRRIADCKQRMVEEYGARLAGMENLTYECWEGRPSMEILKIARMERVDLILMAHHSKDTDPEEAFLGSTVAQVSLNSLCPTMSINRHFDLRCGLMYDQSGDVVDTREHAPA
ncbi:MAG: universal stress protein [Desulfovibrionaceae bacterium]|jgi:nucleotide-binding universal stress UspA family protein|nr:universal stress protein [Desulfovibrionaceae bacterium]